MKHLIINQLSAQFGFVSKYAEGKFLAFDKNGEVWTEYKNTRISFKSPVELPYICIEEDDMPLLKDAFYIEYNAELNPHRYTIGKKDGTQVVCAVKRTPDEFDHVAFKPLPMKRIEVSKEAAKLIARFPNMVKPNKLFNTYPRLFVSDSMAVGTDGHIVAMVDLEENSYPERFSIDINLFPILKSGLIDGIIVSEDERKSHVGVTIEGITFLSTFIHSPWTLDGNVLRNLVKKTISQTIALKDLDQITLAHPNHKKKGKYAVKITVEEPQELSWVKTTTTTARTYVRNLDKTPFPLESTTVSYDNWPIGLSDCILDIAYLIQVKDFLKHSKQNSITLSGTSGKNTVLFEGKGFSIAILPMLKLP